ncbi:MAG: betaine--homocysteine S-methyltransferase [Alphaproteobacteria bacterium]|nr:betaine--homocysteine S-methyltransferase [Alphaproteobacteria bacterium]
MTSLSSFFARRLAERPWLLADGATGTNFFNRGLQAGEAPELWNLSHSDKVRAHYRDFIDAECDIVLTNTFGGNAERLRLHDAASRTHEINLAAAELLCEEAALAGRDDLIVAGSMGPSGSLMAPLGTLRPDEARDIFYEQAKALKEGGVHCAWIETFSSLEEAEAALDGAAAAGLESVITFSFDTAGHTMMGLAPQDLPGKLSRAGAPPAAFGSNCGAGLADFLESFACLAGACGEGDVLVAKANCGVPEYRDGAIHWPADAEQMSAWARAVRDLGARIIGGCCGNTAEHIAAIRRGLLEAN